MSMMPNTSVRPAARRNSIRPTCSPFSPCSSSSSALINGLLPPQGETKESPSPLMGEGGDGGGMGRLHLAGLHVGVGMILENGADDAVGEAPLLVLGDQAQVVVLYRIVVLVEAERAADRLEIGLAQGGAESALVLDPALHRAHRRVDQQPRVVSLR